MQNALIVGAGTSGFLHALALRSAGVRIAAVFDPDFASARHLVELVGGEPCSSFAEALAFDTGIAAICSPPIQHVEQAVALARDGRVVFLEKPVALSTSELDRLRVLPQVIPVLQWRAGQSAHGLRGAIEAGTFGSKPRVRCNLQLWRDSAYFARRGREQWGCGAMLSIGIHAVDLVLWIMNRRVSASAGREWYGRPELDVPTGGELAIEFDGGASASIHITLDAEGHDEVGLRVDGGASSAWFSSREADPTASALSWRGVRPAPCSEAGATGSPLLVPFIHEALSLPALSIDDVAEAHQLAFSLSPSSRPAPPGRSGPMTELPRTRRPGDRARAGSCGR